MIHLSDEPIIYDVGGSMIGYEYFGLSIRRWSSINAHHAREHHSRTVIGIVYEYLFLCDNQY